MAYVPGELVLPPRHWAERVYNVQRWTEMPKGGHFAAMEEPNSSPTTSARISEGSTNASAERQVV